MMMIRLKKEPSPAAATTTPKHEAESSIKIAREVGSLKTNKINKKINIKMND